MGQRIVGVVDRGIDRIWPAQALGNVEAAKIAWWERPARWLFVLLLLVTFPIAVNRAVQQNGGTDFPAFYWSARHILDNGERHFHSEFLRYLPSADVPWMVLAVLPLPAAAVVYYVFACWSWMGLLSTTGHYLLANCSAAVRRQTMLLVGLLVIPIALDGFAVGAFHAFMVWMMVAGLCRVSQGQTWRGGLLLGLAIWVKLLPALGAAYLIWKRKWQPALIAVASVVVADVVLSVVGYGFEDAWRHHAIWWRDEGSGALERQLSSVKASNEDRITNQSIAVVLRHVLTTFGSDFNETRNQVSIGNLSSRQLKVVYFAAIGALGLAGMYYCRRAWYNTSPDQWSAEIALMLLGTLWFSPVVWGYHPTAVVPALAIVLSKGDRYPRIAWGMAVLWVATLALFGIPLARLLGHATIASLVLGAAMVWVSRAAPSRMAEDSSTGMDATSQSKAA
jgi:hypothetical protein